MTAPHQLALAALIVLTIACAGDNTSSDAPVVERTTIGDTTIVRTVSGSAWGDTARLVEEMRIGALEGPEELTFGRIGKLAPGSGGSVDVADDQAMTIRRFDSTGAFVKTIGSRGQGPGEYQSLLGLGTLRDGRLVAYDPRNSRITSYSTAGALLETWPIELHARFFADNAFAVDTSDNMYVLTAPAAPPGGARSPTTVMLRIAPGGKIVDTLPVPQWTTDAQRRGVCLAPGGRWAMHPTGHFVAGSTDAYSIDLRGPSGKVLRIQRAVEPVAFESGERSEIEADIAGSGPPIETVSITRGQAPVITYGPRQTLPPTKPLFRTLLVGNDGRIWVQLHTRAQKVDPAAETVTSPCDVDRKGDPPTLTWSEPIVWDIFESDGRYLGAVTVPPSTTIRVADGDRVWAVQRGQSDEEYVVRYRIARPTR